MLRDEPDTGSSAPGFGQGDGGVEDEFAQQTPQQTPAVMRFIQAVLFAVTAGLFGLLTTFLAYQCWVFYVPALRAAIDPGFKPRFPEYTYEVWGQDFDGLNRQEPWVILLVSVLVLVATGKFVLFAAPAKSPTLHQKTD
eukprot:TRINITY_DN11963_c0_g1_i1.p1 TRINITY_DN11963_c0_g1~~TRINITY_DN11963_c0_g1_i1.p1  ORF type:complete len:139 (-),score=34.04 TRINITY_DN11963_c0_g1_i1:232-648(-)